MYDNYIKLMQIYEWIYNICDYLTYQYIFFSNSVGSYNPLSDPTWDLDFDNFGNTYLFYYTFVYFSYYLWTLHKLLNLAFTFYLSYFQEKKIILIKS